MQVFREIYYKGEGKPSDEWFRLLKDYDGREPLKIFNDSDRSHDNVYQSLKRYIGQHYIGQHMVNANVVSRKKIFYVNMPLQKTKRIPGWLYYEGDWGKMLSGNLRAAQRVENLTNDYRVHSDFVRKLNKYLIENKPDLDYEARSAKGVCVLGTLDYFDYTPNWRNLWR